MNRAMMVWAALSLPAAACLAQSTPLYIADQGAGLMYVVQGGSVVNTFATSGTEAALAVTPTEIRTVGYFAGSQGREYDLAGNPTGPTYTGAWDYTFEGTTDGVNNNYSFQYAGGGMLTSYDRTWQNPTAMFSFGNEQFFGVTMDTSNGSFWGAMISGNTVRNYDSGGQLLHEWTIPTNDHTILAYEPLTDTIWSMSRSDGNNLRQWDKNGQPLNVLPVNGWNQNNILGMEFPLLIPAPGAAALLGLGGLAAAGRRRL